MKSSLPGRPFLAGRRTGRVLLLGFAVALACTSVTPPLPGDELMGKFDFVAQQLRNSCPNLSEVVDGGFAFQGTFSRVADGGQTWLSITNGSAKGNFDGQWVSTSPLINRAPRHFEACRPCETSEVGEAIQVALLSRSQNNAIRNRAPDGCPDDVFDGGLPAADPDAGITRPATTSSGFDAVLACGTLTDYIYGRTEHPECSCDNCSLVYRLAGIRR